MDRLDRDRVDQELITKWKVAPSTVKKYHDSQAVAVMYSYRRRNVPAKVRDTQLNLFKEEV